MSSGAEWRTGQLRDPRVRAVVSAYFDIVTDAIAPADARELSIAIARTTGVDDLFALGRAVRDPQPWVPFLRHLRSIPPRLHDDRAVEAERHLRTTASEMLRLQGLRLVRPEDLIARPTPFEEALASLAPNTI